MRYSSWRDLRFVYDSHAKLGQLGPQSIEIESELPFAQAFTRLLFFRHAFAPEPRYFFGGLPADDDYAVDVADDNVARCDRRAGANNRHVHRPRRRFHGTLSADRLRPHRKLHRGQIRHVSNTGVD